MLAYKPQRIVGNTTGLVQSRENFLIADDAYPVLENAFVWRERIKRKQGFELLGSAVTRVESTVNYDKSGNISKKENETPLTNLTYSYSPGTNKLNAAGDITFKHDENGNITSDSDPKGCCRYYYESHFIK